MDVQFQIRQNAMEMQEYMKDLFDWQKSIKKKERTLAASAASSAQSAPAPRGRAAGTVAAAPTDLMQPALGPKSIAVPPSSSKTSHTAASSAPRTNSTHTTTNPVTKQNAAAHTYSAYSKWDKFDVDAALASDDDDTKPPTAPRSTQHPNPATSTPTPTPPPSSTSSAPAPGAPAPPVPSASPTTGGTSAGQLAPGLPPSPGLPPGITISANPPSQHSTEDLMRPVSTTRRTAPAAPGPPAASSAAPSSSRLTPPPPPQSQQTELPSAGAAAAATATSVPRPPIRNTQPTTADAWRARGNDLFKAGELESAFECYSRSVEMQPTCLGHANRAMALLKLGRWQEAVSDCTAALALDPTYVKAYQRRAAAHRQLGATLEAARDWEAALRLEPDNRATAADRQATLELLMSQQKLQPPMRRVAVPVTSGGGRDGGGGSATAPMGVEGSRLVEQGVGASSSGSGATCPPPPPPPPSQDGALTEGLPQPSVLPPQVAAPEASPPPPSQPQTAPINPQPIPSPSASISTSSSASQPSIAVSDPAAMPPASTMPIASSSQPPTANRSSGGPRSLPGQPRTSVEFEAAWRRLNGQPTLQAAYLSGISPASLPVIFKNSLTGPMLSSMLRCLLPAMTTTVGGTTAAAMTAEASGAAGGITAAASTSAAEAASGGGSGVALSTGVALLEALTKVPRFDLMAMAVPSRERSELRSVWEALEAALGAVGRSSGGAAEGAAAEEVGVVLGRLAALRPKYRI